MRRLSPRTRQWVPTIFVVALVAIGGFMASNVTGSSDNFETVKEIGVGLLTGGLIGGALLVIDERREAKRDEHDAELAASQKRHALAIALTVKDDLAGIVLSGQDLQGIVLSGRNLTGAYLNGAILNLADLTDADLTDADLTLADFKRADFNGTNLTGADFNGAILNQADFNHVRWIPTRPPIWPEGFTPPPNAWDEEQTS